MLKYDLKSVDERTGVRVGIIKSSEVENIATPTHVLNTADIRHIQKLKNAGLGLFPNGLNDTPHQIVEVARYYNEEKLKDIHDPTISDSQVKQLKSFTGAPGKLFLFRPNISRDIKIPERTNRILTDLQIQANFDVITLSDPHFNSDPAVFDKTMRNLREQVENSIEFDYVEAAPLLRLDMPYELFKRKMNIVMDNGFKGVVFPYSSYYTSRHNYLHIRELAQKEELWFHLSGVMKTWHINKKSFLMHVLQPFGFDSFSLRSYRPFSNAVIKQIIAKRLDNKTLGVMDINELEKTYGDDLHCNCYVDQGNGLNSFLKLYNGAEVLSSAIRAHDSYASLQELLKGRVYASEQEFVKYAKLRRFIIEPLKKIFKIDIFQKTLKL